MNKLTKAVIPVAGLGTRFLPITHSIPKEMLPVVDKPILLYIIEEAIDAGFEDIVLVSGRNKTSIENFFDSNYELEDKLEKSGKLEILETLKKIQSSANIISIRQKEALGLGHAVHCSKPIVGHDNFLVMLGDELMKSKPNPSLDLKNIFADKNQSVVSVMEVPQSEVNKYGIVDGEKIADNLIKINDLIEKPSIEEAPSRWALPGRYVFKPELYNYIKDTKPGKNGEIQLTDAMLMLAKNDGLLATEIKCQRYDTGNKLGYLIANIEFALEHPDVSDGLKDYLKNLKL